MRAFDRITAKEIYLKYTEIKISLWGRESWEDGYFVRIVGGKLTSETIRNWTTIRSSR